MFEASQQSIETAALTVRYHLSPWDVPTVGGSVAAITEILVRDVHQARHDFEEFRDGCSAIGVVLVSCKLSHDRLVECGFLESEQFRFIELNYRPEFGQLQSSELGESDGTLVEAAALEDEMEIAGIAGKIFDAGRFHRDPMISPTVGDLRYRRWITNAFRNPQQSVLKCSVDGAIRAFFVVEALTPGQRFWSLVGLAPGLSGHGLGTRIWRAMLRWHRDEGVNVVTTSISSLNVPVFNLYVKLGFRFPAPVITLHWCPKGRIEGAL